MSKIMLQLLVVSTLFLIACSDVTISNDRVVFVVDDPNKIDVMIDGELFTSYLIESQFEGKSLTKPILFPVHTPAGVTVTRSFPFAEVEGESPDHPHHTGIFFTYDEVNESGFWNNTKFPPQIKHLIVKERLSGDVGTLETESEWISKDSVPLLKEERTMKFMPGENEIAIDFTMNLIPLVDKVEFGDTKEGMFAIRVAHQLRENNTGEYVSSNGDVGADNVWGKRAEWVKLEGVIDSTTVGIAILNHPESVNYPTYWHARGYGLFSANPLGQLAFQKTRNVENPEPFGLTIEEGENALFKFRMIIYDGARSLEQMEEKFIAYIETP